MSQNFSSFMLGTAGSFSFELGLFWTLMTCDTSLPCRLYSTLKTANSRRDKDLLGHTAYTLRRGFNCSTSLILVTFSYIPLSQETLRPLSSYEYGRRYSNFSRTRFIVDNKIRYGVRFAYIDSFESHSPVSVIMHDWFKSN